MYQHRYMWTAAIAPPCIPPYRQPCTPVPVRVARRLKTAGSLKFRRRPPVAFSRRLGVAPWRVPCCGAGESVFA